jgi:hypothetical protein
MNVLIFRFLKRLLFLTAGIALIMAVLFGFFLKPYYLPVLPFLLFFFFGFTFLTFSFLVKVAKKGFPNFIRAIMLVTVTRLLLYTVLAALYIAVIGEGVVCFVAVIGSFYLIFTLFEVLELMSGLRKSDKEKLTGKDKL